MRTSKSFSGIAACAVVAMLAGCALGSPFATDAPATDLPPSPSTATTGTPADTQPTETSSPSPAPDPTAVPDPTPAPATSSNPGATPEPPDATQDPEAEDFPRRVPKVTIRTDDVTYALRPWTWCYLPGCLDGLPPNDPPSVGQATQVEVEFPIGEWTFVAEFKEVGPRCPRTQQVTLPRTGDNTWLIEPAGYAGTYDVDVFGWNDGGNDAPAGDVVVTFHWETPLDGELAKPTAYGGVFSLTRNGIESYGADLRLIDLAAPPDTLRVEMTVTSSNGKSFSFEFEPHLSCNEDVYFDAPNNVAEKAKDLGPAPYTYDVVLMLDGQRHTAHAVWPRENEQLYDHSMEFEFTPPLPALQPRP